MKQLKIYKIRGYCGHPNAYDGPSDYNFTDIVAVDASLSLKEAKKKISKMLTPDNAYDAVCWTYDIIGVVDVNE